MENTYLNQRKELEVRRANNRLSYENEIKSYDEYSKEERKINRSFKRIL